MANWHLSNLTAATGAPDGPQGLMSAYAFEAQGTQHVFYSGIDRHIYELWWDANGWHHNDLTAATGAPDSVSSPAGYVFEAQGTQHVVYSDIGHNIHELWWDPNGWHHSNLTAATGGAATGAFAFDTVSGYAFEAQGTQHVVYESIGSHIHELWWDPNGWHHNDLTAATGAAAAGTLGGPPVVAYAFEAQGTQHVVYSDKDRHIHELRWDANGWHHNDLTATTTAHRAVGIFSGYVFEAQGTQHIFYVSDDVQPGDFHLYELRRDANGWHNSDLTVATGGAAPRRPGGSGPSGYVFEAQGTQHVVYEGKDRHIHELWWDPNGWHHNDLTAATGVPLPFTIAKVSGYAFEAQGTQHVVYESIDRHIYELWWG